MKDGLNVCEILVPTCKRVIPLVIGSLVGRCRCCSRCALCHKVCFYNGVSYCAFLFSIEIYVIVGSGRTAGNGVNVSCKIGYVGVGDNVLKYRLGLVVLEVNCSVNVLYNNAFACGNVFKSNLIAAANEDTSRYLNVCKLNEASSNAVAENKVAVYGTVLESDVRNVYHEGTLGIYRVGVGYLYVVAEDIVHYLCELRTCYVCTWLDKIHVSTVNVALFNKGGHGTDSPRRNLVVVVVLLKYCKVSVF